MEDLDLFAIRRRPTPARPLAGLTILAVEDSRFASEALRLLCLTSGARLRRADSLAAARRHLQVYRPAAAIVDLGLPDGSGAELIAELAQARPRIGALLGLSGDAGAERIAARAGADGFLAKPVESLSAFQEALLRHLPQSERPVGPRALAHGRVAPDTIAYHDDIGHAANLLREASDGPTLSYVARFLAGVADAAADRQLADAARELQRPGRTGAHVARLTGLIAHRLEQRAVI